MARGKILVIDDEKDLVELLRYNLEKEGFTVRSAHDGEAGLSAAKKDLPDLILVDLMLPGIDGLDVCRALRSDSRTSRIPLIMLTAKSAESDRVLGLELGADDYITKPFSPRELVARIKAVLRRTAASRTAPEIIQRGKLTIDTAKRVVMCGQAPVALTATEFRLLQFLASHSGRVFSRAQLIDSAMGRDVTVEERTIDVHITGLRKKLGNCGEWIETVRGFGYRFRDEEDSY